MKKDIIKRIQIVTTVSLLSIFLCACGAGSTQKAKESDGTTVVSEETSSEPSDSPGSSDSPESDSGSSSLSHEGYTLEKVVVLSRHNIRSPLSGGDSLLGMITPHTWFAWTSNPSELSLRGGTLETEMGQYFRTWLEEENLFPDNYQPEDEAVRIYANSKQRTIATARYFSSGLLPTADVDVEYHEEFDKMDPVFNPQLTFDSDNYSKAAEEEMEELSSDSIHDLSDNYELMSDVIDLEESPAYKDGTVKDLSTDDTHFILNENEEPKMEGSLKTACSVSDALVLQYYETEDAKEAAFDNDLSTQQWEDIAEIKDVYVDALYTSPLIAVNVSNPLLKEIEKELSEDKRKFTFMCGHDSNLGSVLAALDVEDYELPDAIEKKTPIGSKVVFSQFKGKDGSEKLSVDLVYQSVDQLRDVTLLESGVHPVIYPLSFKGIQRDEDGLFDLDEFNSRLSEAIGEYDKIVEEYK